MINSSNDVSTERKKGKNDTMIQNCKTARSAIEAHRFIGWHELPGGEQVYTSRRITIFLNPENDFVIHVSVYVQTTVEEYIDRLRQVREKCIYLCSR